MNCGLFHYIKYVQATAVAPMTRKYLKYEMTKNIGSGSSVICLCLVFAGDSVKAARRKQIDVARQPNATMKHMTMNSVIGVIIKKVCVM